MTRIIDTKKMSAEQNMRYDEELLAELLTPVLHFYDWEKKSLTYGYFTKIEKYLDVEELKCQGFECAKRPTGGGIVFHTSDLAFSFLLPNTHPAFSQNVVANYHFVNNIVLSAIQEFLPGQASFSLIPVTDVKRDGNFCMARATKYDILLSGAKVVGAAERMGKKGYLHQGSIFLSSLDRHLLEKILLMPAKDLLENSTTLLPSFLDATELAVQRHKLKVLLAKQFVKQF